MKEKIQIKNVFGIILFEYESENNTIKKTLEEAVRQGVDLNYAFLAGVDLNHADLEGAKLQNAILICASLKGANLIRANLKYADLSEANLAFADLKEAYLFEATLRFTNLTEAFLRYAILVNTKYIPFIPLNLPEGEFIAYKKVCHHEVNYIIKLKVLADSKRSRAATDKCRCDKALVLEIQNLDGSKSELKEITVYSFTPICTYKVGEIVESDFWDENRFNECSYGIDFFLDRQRAVNY